MPHALQIWQLGSWAKGPHSWQARDFAQVRTYSSWPMGTPKTINPRSATGLSLCQTLAPTSATPDGGGLMVGLITSLILYITPVLGTLFPQTFQMMKLHHRLALECLSACKLQPLLVWERLRVANHSMSKRPGDHGTTGPEDHGTRRLQEQGTTATPGPSHLLAPSGACAAP